MGYLNLLHSAIPRFQERLTLNSILQDEPKSTFLNHDIYATLQNKLNGIILRNYENILVKNRN